MPESGPKAGSDRHGWLVTHGSEHVSLPSRPPPGGSCVPLGFRVTSVILSVTMLRLGMPALHPSIPNIVSAAT